VEEIKTYLKDYGILDEFIPSIRAHALPYHDQGILSDVRFPTHLKLVTNL
jgi:hypothetical protein